MSTRYSGLAIRSFIIGNRLWPPATIIAPSPSWSSNPIAWSTLVARSYSNGPGTCMATTSVGGKSSVGPCYVGVNSKLSDRLTHSAAAVGGLLMVLQHRLVVVNSAFELRQRTPPATPLTSDDLRGDRHRGLLRGARAQIEPYRAGQSAQLGVGESCLAQPRDPVGVGASRSHCPDVAHVSQPQRDRQDGHVKLRVVGQHADHRAPVDGARLHLRRQVAVRPVHDDFVGAWEARGRREHRAGVANG